MLRIKHEAAMMCQNSQITQQHLRQFLTQHNEKEEVGYVRRLRQDGFQATDQADDSQRKRDTQGRGDFRRG